MMDASSSEILTFADDAEARRCDSSSAGPASAFSCDAVDASLALLAFFDNERRFIMAASEDEVEVEGDERAAVASDEVVVVGCSGAKEAGAAALALGKSVRI